MHAVGGHTAEMLALLGKLDRSRYTPRTYVIASTDAMGAQKAMAAEAEQQPSSSVSTWLPQASGLGHEQKRL